MRILLMLLVLANLGLFAWLNWYGPDSADRLPPGRAEPGSATRLVLVEERAEEHGALAGRNAAEPVETQPESAPRLAGADPQDDAGEEAEPALVRCATIGPFDQLDLARLARQRLAELDAGASVRESGGQIRSGFWVYLPPFASRSEARQAEAALRERGVSDLFIVTASDQQNAISLGLFSTPERADQRAAQIGRLGFTPRVAERFRDATVYWVDFREPENAPLEPESIGVAGAGETVPEKHEISCADVANTGGEA